VTASLPTRKCSHCGERFSLTPRRGRNSDKRHATQATRSYHLGARYCKEACRKAASKARRRSSTVARKAEKMLPPSALLSSVTRAKNSVDVSMPCMGEKTDRGSPNKLDPRIAPDGHRPHMYRISRSDGSLTDMVNLTRARDALAAIRDEDAA
jgi:hypothetical protein